MNSVDHTKLNFNDYSELHCLVSLHNVGSHIKFSTLLKMFIKESTLIVRTHKETEILNQIKMRTPAKTAAKQE